MNPWIIGVLALAAGAVIGWLLNRQRMAADSRAAGGMLAGARKEADALLRESRVAAQDETHQLRETAEKEIKERRLELGVLEKRLLQRETNLDRRVDLLDRKTEEQARKEQQIAEREQQLHAVHEELDSLKKQVRQELQRIAGISREDARKMLLSQLEEQARAEAATLSRQIVENARQSAERDAQRILTIAIERCATEHVQSATSCTVSLPNEEMKGRIIGREGRNIRAFEAATGINVLIDDTPQAVVLSGFDPVRREQARQALERLISDGRINPARIEEEVARVGQEMIETIRKAGDEAVYQLGLAGVHPHVVETLGRLKFRHSFSQNVLDHSIEVAFLAGMIAAELGLDQQLARRTGLFHDIGKALDHEMAGSHAVLGAEFLKKYGEPPEVWEGVACHHHEAEPLTVYGMLAGTGDAISASRPGARSESIELYLQRLEKLEAIAQTFAGVERSYALQAGREVRVFVEPTRVTDEQAVQLARDIRAKIEEDLLYPGQIRIMVVRETRTIEYAK